MTGERKERWYLVVVAFGVAFAILALVTRTLAAPQMPRYWLILDAAVFAMACGVGCFLGNTLGSNGRSKAVLGVMFSLMLMWPLASVGVRHLFGNWASLACALALPLTVVLLGLLFRNWFQGADHRSADEADRS